MFERADFALLASVLGGLKGSFIMSLNDRPEVREVFAAFNLCPIMTTYSVAGGGGKVAPELLIHNLDPGLVEAALGS